MGEFADAKREAAERAAKEKEAAEGAMAESHQRVKHLLTQFDGDCNETYRLYADEEDGKGGRILTHKETAQKFHIQSPGRDVFTLNGGPALRREEMVKRMLREIPGPSGPG